MENTHIAVQTENFSVGEQYQWLAQCDSDGAVVTLRGKCNHNLGDSVAALTLEHYPGMTEKVSEYSHRSKERLAIAES